MYKNVMKLIIKTYNRILLMQKALTPKNTKGIVFYLPFYKWSRLCGIIQTMFVNTS